MTANGKARQSYYEGLEYYCPLVRGCPNVQYNSQLKRERVLSARNQFKGTVVKIQEGDIVGQVVVDIGCGNLMSSIITTASIRELGIKVCSKVTAIVKSTAVTIMTPMPEMMHKEKSTGRTFSARNQFKGKVVKIQEGDIVGQVVVDIGCGNLMSSIITTASIRELGIRVGSEAIAIAKSTDVTIMV
jgi:molybdate transport system regulatory protein